MSGARLVAAQVLMSLDLRPTTLTREIERARGWTTDARDRALVLELVAGTLRWRNELDAVITACSRRPASELGAEVRAALRLGAYQLLHLDRIPAHAIVNESVELVRTLKQPRAAGFVNAVLRSLIRRGKSLKLPARPESGSSRDAQLAYLTTTLSHPAWLAGRWLDRHGFDATAEWCEFNDQVPEITVRVLAPATPDAILATLRESGVTAEPCRWVPGALRLPPGALGRLPPDLAASLFVQDEASQLVALAVGAQPGEAVLDLCAAPGGKTTLMAEVMEGRGGIVAADHRAARVRVLAGTLARTGTRAAIVRLDATQPLPFGDAFDRVLLDAPCSGLGTLRRDPDVKWTREDSQLPEFAARQREMLAQAATAVRPGGTLVYATCSSEPEENESQIDAFLEAHPAFSLAPVRLGGVAGADQLVDARGFMRTLPFRHGLDAFFAAALVRRKSA